jgi:hypothetical protein
MIIDQQGKIINVVDKFLTTFQKISKKNPPKPDGIGGSYIR